MIRVKEINVSQCNVLVGGCVEEFGLHMFSSTVCALFPVKYKYRNN